MSVSSTMHSDDGAPLTRLSLLLQLRDDANHEAWREFASIYGPIVYGYARKRGLQDADAADVMQDVLRSVSSAIGRLNYDRTQGTFRGWMFTITRNKVFNFLSARKGRPQGAGNTAANQMLGAIPDAHEDHDEWELEYRRRLAASAMNRIQSEFQENTWRAFLLTAVEGRAASEAAAEIGISTGAVYVAKSRVLSRLKQEVETLVRLEDETA